MRLIPCLLAFFSCFSALADTFTTTDTNLIIIGSRHDGNRQLSHKDLFRKIESLKPDVILWEYDGDFKKVFGVQTAAALRIARVSIEQRALQRYAKKYPGVPILGFDTGFARKSTVKEMANMGGRIFDSIYAAYNQDRMSASDSMHFEYYLHAQNHFLGTLLEGPLDSMNSNPWLEKLTLYFALDEAIHCHMASRYVQDTALVNWYAMDNRFWNDRNNVMVRRILEYRKTYAGKRVVVVTGLAHKPELLRLMDLTNLYPLSPN